MAECPIIPWETRIGNYLMIRQVGCGAFSSVWAACHEITRLPVAVKIISKGMATSVDEITRLTRELALLQQLHHPFVAEFFESLEDDHFLYYVMEFVDNGNIQSFVNAKTRLSEAHARHYFSQIMSVLEYLHTDKLICHRDLKGDNILLDQYDNIRLIDFGLSNQFSESAPNLSTRCGSPAYAAPEMIAGHAYTSAADLWSSGIVLYFMVTGEVPWKDDDIPRLLAKIVHTDPTFPPYLSGSLVDLLRKLLVKNPDYRITLGRVKEHPWFSQVQYTALLSKQVSELQTRLTTIDRELVDELSQLGVDCRLLPQQLLAGQYTELTSMYRMLHRHKLTKVMGLNEVDSIELTTARDQPRPVKRQLGVPNISKGLAPGRIPRGKGIMTLTPGLTNPGRLVASATQNPALPGIDSARPMWRAPRQLIQRADSHSLHPHDPMSSFT
jgi:serine/threonine protein kinase